MEKASRLALYMMLAVGFIFLTIIFDLFLSMLFIVTMISLMMYIGYKKTGDGTYLFTGKVEKTTSSTVDGEEKIIRVFECLRCKQVIKNMPCSKCGGKAGKMIFL